MAESAGRQEWTNENRHMRCTLIAAGRRRQGPEQTLFQVYADRLSWPLDVKLVAERKALSGDELKVREAELLLGAVPDGAVVAALDERGEALSSPEFAAKLGDWRDSGVKHAAFLVGGADGLDDRVRRKASLILSFGRLTWPHQLVPALLAEQLYRANAILSGHPYHRE